MSGLPKKPLLHPVYDGDACVIWRVAESVLLPTIIALIQRTFSEAVRFPPILQTTYDTGTLRLTRYRAAAPVCSRRTAHSARAVQTQDGLVVQGTGAMGLGATLSSPSSRSNFVRFYKRASWRGCKWHETLDNTRHSKTFARSGPRSEALRENTITGPFHVWYHIPPCGRDRSQETSKAVAT